MLGKLQRGYIVIGGFNVFSSGKNCARLLNIGTQVHYSSQLRKWEPRSDRQKEYMMPWKYRRDHEPGWFSKLLTPNMQTDILRIMTGPIDLRSSKIKSWYEKKMSKYEVDLQSFQSERHSSLGKEISAGYAFYAVGGTVLYKGKQWIKGDFGTEYPSVLPDEYDDTWVLEAIDLSNTCIRHEGLRNLHNLHSVHTLSVQNCSYIDDWCLDLIASELLSLEVLNLSGCLGVTHRGLAALTRLPNLRKLYLNNCPEIKTPDGQLMCLLLQDYNTALDIEGVDFPVVPDIESTSKSNAQ